MSDFQADEAVAAWVLDLIDEAEALQQFRRLNRSTEWNAAVKRLKDMLHERGIAAVRTAKEGVGHDTPLDPRRTDDR